ncbi:cadmium-translocating P-type ATPase [Paenibacillus sp. IB182496]|uniref:Cd(2+)-exporting ATPase n=1 Tax=Paenibacillus sabuli TaxID=2772509 RepID=A0A927BPY3_9BACL|nr:heavy metal translocating P-type ATPase [Paenibacillus sabuli]MBD2844117.1 cadmium-translocating P-type ATPase [Paenibacillus sabuli]
MHIYKVKGLSCGNCAQGLEAQIQKLAHGADASLSFASGRLKLDPAVDLDSVERILRSDGAVLDRSSLRRAPGSANGASGEGAAARHEGEDACAQGGCDGSHRHDGSDKSDRGEHGHDHLHAHEHTPARSHVQRHAHGHDHAHDHGQGHDHGHGHEHGHDHDHAHGGTRTMLALLAVSGLLYAAALLLEGIWSAPVLIGMYLGATAISGYTTFWRGLQNLMRLRFTIDTLMTIALIGAVAIGEWREATLVAILFGVNELLEGIGMDRARRSMEALLEVAPKQAILLQGERQRTVAISELRAGDLVLVRAGDKVPSDGTIEQGDGSVNEAAITGESLPVDKTSGDTVFGGSINNEGTLRVRIDKPYDDSSLARILHLVEEAQETKTPTELFINRFAKVYTPLIMVVAALVILVPPLLLGGEWTHWLYQGLAVLIVGCPCALVLASPIAIVSGITRSARAGILVKGGVHLEQLGKLDAIAFDKTGTLTKGEPRVIEAVAYDADRFYSVAAAIERQSSHPLAHAVMAHIEAERRHGDTLQAEEVRTVAGKGVVARIAGHAYRLGNEQALDGLTLGERATGDIARLKQDGLTLVLVADEASVLGMFGIADEIREESRRVVDALHRIGIRDTVMLTGDHEATARRVAAATGVRSYHSGLLPEDKVARIRELGAHGRIAMIGDGINDAPALATAQLGIAMGKGTASAIETADVVLMQDHLGRLPEAIGTAKRVNRAIRFNIAAALGLKLVALLLTIPGWLTLWIAILSDMGATIFVTLVSLTILVNRSPRRVNGAASEPQGAALQEH